MVILKAAAAEPTPLYGDGANVRNWLYVEDHVDALLLMFRQGRLGRSYCVSGSMGDGSASKRSIREVVEAIGELLDQLRRRGHPMPS